jgi:hypothetical protein
MRIEFDVEPHTFSASVQTHEERLGSADPPRWPPRAAFLGRRKNLVVV